MLESNSERADAATGAEPQRIAAHGFHVERRAMPAGVVETSGFAELVVSLHSGPPVRATCLRDGRSYSGVHVRGDIEIVPAGEKGRWEDEDPAEVLMMRLDRPFLVSVAQGLALDPARLEIVPQYRARDTAIANIGWALEAALQETPPDRLLLDSLGNALATRVIRRYSSLHPEPVRHGLTRRQLRAVIEYIDANLAAPMRLGDLAGVVGLSDSHFKVQFRRATGVPPHRFVIARRLDRAVALIKAERMELSQIAFECGFAHQSHLARVMRRSMGVTPTMLTRELR